MNIDERIVGMVFGADAKRGEWVEVYTAGDEIVWWRADRDVVNGECVSEPELECRRARSVHGD